MSVVPGGIGWHIMGSTKCFKVYIYSKIEDLVAN